MQFCIIFVDKKEPDSNLSLRQKRLGKDYKIDYLDFQKHICAMFCTNCYSSFSLTSLTGVSYYIKNSVFNFHKREYANMRNLARRMHSHVSNDCIRLGKPTHKRVYVIKRSVIFDPRNRGVKSQPSTGQRMMMVILNPRVRA